MKVTVYSETGVPVGIAWHEDDAGTITLPPATEPVVVTHFTINDGPKIRLSHAVLMPVDTDFKMVIYDPLSRIRAPVVDKETTTVTWWRRAANWVKEALTWTY
jgi:hypothetical protein